MPSVVAFPSKCAMITQEELALFRCSLNALRSVYAEMERRRNAIEDKIARRIPQEPGELVYVVEERIALPRSELKRFG